MLEIKEAQNKACLQNPALKCSADSCTGWMPAQRNKPDQEGEYGQCIHHLGLQALMNVGAVIVGNRVIH